MPSVLIGCKLPNGIILELITPPEADVSKQGLIPKPTGERVTLKGANSLRTNTRSSLGQFAYAVTRVDKGFWDKWLARYKDLDFIKNGLVFEAKNQDEFAAIARERAGLRTQLEPLAVDITSDPRVPKGTTTSTKLEADPASVAAAQRNQQDAADAAA
jgi:hypothetical protein